MLTTTIRKLAAALGIARRALSQSADPALSQSDYDQMRRVMLK